MLEMRLLIWYDKRIEMNTKGMKEMEKTRAKWSFSHVIGLTYASDENRESKGKVVTKIIVELLT